MPDTNVRLPRTPSPSAEDVFPDVDRRSIYRSLIATFLKNQFLWLFVFVAIVATLSWKRGSFQAEFCDLADEPPHYVTGLMVRDYLASGVSTPPMQYAENYYHHYPKVALGHWPPMFYVVEALWMLIFSESRWSVLLLMCVQAAILTLVLEEVIRRDLPRVYGIGAGLFLLSLPLVQRLSSTVMSDILVAMLVFAAAVQFAEYLESPGRARAVVFGLISCLAVLTKATGFVLVLVPPISILLTSRFNILKRPSFWIPAIIVFFVCGPWYLLAPAARHQDVAEFGGIYFGYYQVMGFFHDTLRCVGILPFILAGIGVGYRVTTSFRTTGLQYRWAVCVALCVGFLIFRCFVAAATETRHFLLVVPAILWLAAVGVWWVRRSESLFQLRSEITAVLAIGTIWAISSNLYGITKKQHRGFDEIAAYLLSEDNSRSHVTLISADPTIEGALIAEIAMRENKRPDHIVLRASKDLASSDWMGRSYALLYKTEAELLRHLENSHVGFVVIDPILRKQPEDQRLLLALIDRLPDRFKLRSSYPQTSPREVRRARIRVYEFQGAPKVGEP
jgi:hypothetical protein